MSGILGEEAGLVLVDFREVYDYQQQRAVADQQGRVADLLADQREESLVYGPNNPEVLAR